VVDLKNWVVHLKNAIPQAVTWGARLGVIKPCKLIILKTNSVFPACESGYLPSFTSTAHNVFTEQKSFTPFMQAQNGN
jgi:hypothetical protein